MKIREHIQDGRGRLFFSVAVPLLVGWASLHWWPTDVSIQEKWLGGFQKVAFVGGAFAVTAYNLRTRVVDLITKSQAKPEAVDAFSRIARQCGRRLTNLVVLFTITSVLLGGLTIFNAGSRIAAYALAIATALFSASMISFVYIIFAFERLERFALDEAVEAAQRREGARLFPPGPKE